MLMTQYFVNNAEVKIILALGIGRSDLDPNVLGTLIKIDQKPFSIYPLAQEKQIEKENKNKNKEDYRQTEICK